MKFGRKVLLKGFVLLLVMALLLSFSAATLLAAPGFLSSGGPANPGDKVDVLVGFHGPPDREVIAKAGGEIYAEFTIVNVIGARMAPGAADALARKPRVSYVEPDGPVYAVETAAASSTQTVPWGIDRVFGPEEHSFATWESAKGSGIGVAVLDTGIDGKHVDLPALSGGINTVDNTDYDVDQNSHGTHVAGTIAALDNNIGVVGVAPKVDLYAVKVLNASGSGTMSTVTAGVQWAVDKGIKVINMSLSGGYSETLQDACQVAYNNGHLLVAAVGNSGNPGGGGDNVGYPAAYDSVIAVAASDGNDNRARFSSTGPAVELIAPGVSIRSTIPGDGYGTKSGTSMASPHVAGVAALVWSAKPELTSAGLRTVLQVTAEDLGLNASHQGYGLVRADLAVAAALEMSDPDPVVSYKLTLEVNPLNAGTVTGAGDYEAGTNVEISAVANEGYKFESWMKGDTVISNDEAYSYTMPDSNVTLTANFNEVESEPVEPDPSNGMFTVSSIDYTAPGPHLRVIVTVVEVDGEGKLLPNSPVAGAAVSINLWLGDKIYSSDTDTTDSDGKVTFSYHRVPSGVYNTVVTAVDAGDLEWDNYYPENSYTK